MNAALTAHLRELGPLWMKLSTAAGKSLQSWFPCRDTDEQAIISRMVSGRGAPDSRRLFVDLVPVAICPNRLTASAPEEP